MERLLEYFIPEHYTLDLQISRKKATLSGTAEITGMALKNVAKFHAVGLQIESVQLNSTDQVDFRHDGEVLEIDLGATQRDQKLTFTIKFQTELNRNMQGCYLSTYEYKGKEQTIVTTQFESHYAREAFPCVDEPAAKATFALSLTLLEYEDQDVVLANMPLKPASQEETSTSQSEDTASQAEVATGQTKSSTDQKSQRFEFETSPRMSTYLLAWVAGPLHGVSTVNRNGIQVSSYGSLSQPLSALEFANDTAARALEYYDEKFGEKYPLPKLDQVALPDFEAGAMENWGLVTYRESMMLADTTATLDTKKSVATTVTHELSHQWFGDLVTMAWWDDLWLNESFATVIEYYAVDALYPEFQIWRDFFTGDCLAALRRDCLPGVQSVRQEVHHPAEIATLFDGAIVYAKGARLILMLMRMMGEAKFDQGLRDYFDKYQYQNTVGNDLWAALQPYARFSVKEFMDAWLDQPGYPAVTTTGEQHRFLIDGSTDDSRWSIPELKDDMSGHYLIQLNDAEFAEKLSRFDQLSSEQKLRLLIDRILLAKTPTIPAASLLELIPKFSAETSADIWGILASVIGDLKLFCPPESDSMGNYQKYLRNVLATEFEQIDYGDLDDVDAMRRRDLILGVARYAEAETVLQDLNVRYSEDLDTINPELRSHILSAKLYFDEVEVFQLWLDRYQTEVNPELKSELIYTLASLSREPAHLDRLLELLEQPEIVRPQDHLFLFVYLMRNYRTRDRALDWMINHWDYIEQLTGEKSVEDYPRYAAGLIRTQAEADRFYGFFDSKHDNPVLERTLKVARVDIDSRLRLIESDAQAVQEKLALA